MSIMYIMLYCIINIYICFQCCYVLNYIAISYKYTTNIIINILYLYIYFYHCNRDTLSPDNYLPRQHMTDSESIVVKDKNNNYTNTNNNKVINTTPATGVNTTGITNQKTDTTANNRYSTTTMRTKTTTTKNNSILTNSTNTSKNSMHNNKINNNDDEVFDSVHTALYNTHFHLFIVIYTHGIVDVFEPLVSYYFLY